MGLPGSGKSAFSHSLVSDHHNGIDVEKRRENHKYYIINQNKMEEKHALPLPGYCRNIAASELTYAI